MKNSTVLVTGNLGYIGPILAHYLKEKYPLITLIGLDNAYFQGALLSPYLSNDQLYDIQLFGDIRNYDFSKLPHIDAIVSLAAVSNDPMGKEYESATFDINTHSTIALAKFAKSHGVNRFVFASSCSVYGAGGDNLKNENSRLNPLTAYAKSKILCEEELEKLSTNSFVTTALRFSTACGASPRLRLDLVLNDFVASAMLQKNIHILSDGSPWRPLINVKDMCRAIDWSLHRDLKEANFLAINIGADSWNYQVKELALAVKEVFTNTTVFINPSAEHDSRSYRVDFRLFNALAPEYTPLETLQSTILDLKNSLTNSNFTSINFRDSHLIRLKVLEKLRLMKRLNQNLEWIY